MKRIISIFLLTYPILVFTGCGHTSTYQSPKILNQGEKLLGTGISINTNKEFPLGLLSDLSIYVRYGLSDRAENGLKLSFSLPFLFASYHYKYLLLQTTPEKSMKKPLLVSGDLGLAIGISTGGTPAVGFHPTLLFGREDFYGGVSTNLIFPLPYHSSRIFAGASMGNDKWKFNPEISYDILSIPHGKATLRNQIIVVGFSIQRIFGEKNIVARKVARNERLRKIKKKLGISDSEKNYPSIVDKTFSVHSGLGSARGIGLFGFSKDLLITDNIGVYFSGGMGTPVSSTHMTYGVGTFFQNHYNNNGWNIAALFGMAPIGGQNLTGLIYYQYRLGKRGLVSVGLLQGAFLRSKPAGYWAKYFKDPGFPPGRYKYTFPIISYDFRF